MIDPKLLLIFAKVVECGGITAAARVLGLPKATVSRAIVKTESSFSSRLLERSSRRFRVTEAGAILFEHCQRIAGEIETAEAAVATLQGVERGRLKVATPFTFGHFILSPILGEFLAAHPDIQIDLELTNRRVDPVEEAFDFVVRVGVLEETSMIAKSLGDVAYGLFASASYLKSAAVLKHPNDLVHHSLLGSFAGAERNTWIFSEDAKGEGKKRVRVDVGRTRLDVNDPFVRLDAAIAGLGIALLPVWLVKTRQADASVRRLLPSWKPIVSAPVSVLYPNRRSVTPRSRAFLSFLEKRVVPMLA
ncbi:LysR family transcriptional regulator [Roseiarcaceae bacterium H3SJ34-1]|uniref:LysR family transcriptional regulator n=1 Tax=Terripilifer ovatus TaxID=3032367 RepID=UPI003AB9A1C1|nr:LysR family transcriptional regulator [Roseiarcaceae bacterium H3SJ34-1]